MARRAPVVYCLVLVIGVLLAHLAVLVWLQTLIRQPAPADRKPPTALLYHVIAPAPPPQTEQLPAVVHQTNVPTPATKPAKRLRVVTAPPITAARTAPTPMPPGAGDGATVSIVPPSGQGERGNQLDLTLSPRFDPTPSVAHKVQRQLEQSGSSSAAKIDGGSVTVTKDRFSDGSTIQRVTTPLGTYCVRIPDTANAPFMSDLPAHRTALPGTCPSQ
jgi:hypothetical protein